MSCVLSFICATSIYWLSLLIILNRWMQFDSKHTWTFYQAITLREWIKNNSCEWGVQHDFFTGLIKYFLINVNYLSMPKPIPVIWHTPVNAMHSIPLEEFNLDEHSQWNEVIGLHKIANKIINVSNIMYRNRFDIWCVCTSHNSMCLN